MTSILNLFSFSNKQLYSGSCAIDSITARALQDVAARAYAYMLQEAAQALGPTAAFFQLWPLGPARQPWSVLTQGPFEHLGAYRVVHTHARGGQWLLPDQAVYLDGAALRCLVLLTLKLLHAPGAEACVLK